MFFSVFNDYFLYVRALNIFAVIKHFAKHGEQPILIHLLKCNYGPVSALNSINQLL